MSLPVLILNGLGAPRLAARLYGRVLGTFGFDVHTMAQRWLGYGDVRVTARAIGRAIDDVRQKTGAAQVKLVGMSLGGLTGFYHLACGGDARAVERFIAVGGPMNGSSVARLLDHVPSKVVHALAQTSPDSALMRELHAAPLPDDVRLVSVGTRGDVLTPRASWDVPGFEPVETPYGLFPLGHWLLFTHPGNIRVVAELLAD